MLSNLKQCTNCGADNDLLFTYCQFCKSALPHIDFESISNEDLIQSAAEWVGKTGAPFTVQGPNVNEWTGRGIRRYNVSEIEGFALRYLTLLELRAKGNINLGETQRQLKTEFERKRNSGTAKLFRGDYNKKVLVFGCGIPFALMMIFWIISLLYSVKSLNDPDLFKDPNKDLKSIEEEIIKRIEEKDYDKALILTNKLEYDGNMYNRSDSAKIASWHERRKSYQKMIYELRKNN